MTNYDESQIEVDYMEIDGKKVPIQKIPEGMSGPNGKPEYKKSDDEDPIVTDDEDDFEKIISYSANFNATLHKKRANKIYDEEENNWD